MATDIGTLDFTHYRGDTFAAVNFDVTIDGAPVNLTDVAIKMQLRRNYDRDVALELSIGNGLIKIVDAEAGMFRIAEQIIDIEPLAYLYDIQFTIGQKVETFIKGKFVILNDVTR